MTTGRLVSDKSALTHDIYQLERNIHQQLNGQVKKKKNTIRLSRQSSKAKLEHLVQTILPFKENYIQKLNELADNLWGISSHLFKQLTAEDLKKNKDGEIQSDSYLAYFNASNNLSAFVVDEILGQPTVELALIVMDRWAYILKNMFERNDYFSAAAISAGLRYYRIDRLELHNYLEPNFLQVTKYFEGLVLNNSGLFNLQQRKSHDREEVIPALFTLYAMMEKLNGTPRGETEEAKGAVEEHVATARRSMSDGLLGMQTRLKLLQHAYIRNLAEKFSQPEVAKESDVVFFINEKFARKHISVFKLLELTMPEDGVYAQYIKLSTLLVGLRDHALSCPANAQLQALYKQVTHVLDNNGLSSTVKLSSLKKIEMNNSQIMSGDAALIIGQMKETLTHILSLKPERRLGLTSSLYGQVFPGQEKMSKKSTQDNLPLPAKGKKVKKRERRWTVSLDGSIEKGIDGSLFFKQKQELSKNNAEGDEFVGELKRTLTLRGLKKE